jgi:quinoprotein dehydrogenase-associated probable ABC transporter substrate-binding protein
MSSRCLSAGIFCLSALLQAKTLRVCADPNNLPYSNQAGQGFDNKLAEMVAGALNTSVEYTWISDRKKPMQEALENGQCDVLMGVPASAEDVATTAPYYRSSYVFVSRADRRLAVSSLLDPSLAHLRIGISIVGEDYAPPAFALARHGITQNVTPFSLAEPVKIFEALDRRDIDIAIVWGPLAGYYAESARYRLAVTTVSPAAFQGVPFTFDIAMAVRKGDDTLRNELNRVLSEHAPEIRTLLNHYGIPQVH